MVNNKTAKIKLIFDILHKSRNPVSGERLASALGISRVAVWKTISGLKDQGYRIESTHAGYRIISSIDKPVPWEMGAASDLIEYHEELDSTMHKASVLIDSGCADGTTIIAGSQTDGHNSSGGSWKSPDGGLYFTRIRMRSFPAFYTGLYSVAMTTAAVKLLRQNYGIEAVIDWPGGIEFKGRKLGGLLTEFRGSRDTVTAAALGVGLNLNNTESLPDGAVAMNEIIGQKVSVKELTSNLLGVLNSCDKDFTLVDRDEIFTYYIKQAGKTADIEKQDGRNISGTIVELHPGGALVLDTGTSMEYIFSGDKTQYE